MIGTFYPLVWLFDASVSVLWWLELLTATRLKRLLRSNAIFVLFLVDVAFFSFLAFTFKVGFIEKVANGVFVTVNGYSCCSVYNPDQVLGASSQRTFPLKVKDIPLPELTAKSIYVVDQKNSKVLYSKNEAEKLAPASTTKLVTAMVALDIYSPSDTLVVPEECTQVDSTKAWLYQNATYKVSDIIESLLVASGGDSACVLSTGKISADQFISLMNRKLTDAGINNTHLTNVIGLDSSDGSHYSTSEDLYKIAVLARSNKDISKFVSTKDFVLKSVDGLYVSPLTNTNKLLWEIPGTVGVKTGKTVDAGEVLIYEYKDSSKDIYIVVMGSQDRFADTKNLLNWSLASYKWN